jgi:hypothetical protein
LPGKRLFELTANNRLVGEQLATAYSEGSNQSTVRKLLPIVSLLLLQCTYSFAAPAVVQSSVIPEPGLLALLGGGLVGLAALIRRHLSD